MLKILKNTKKVQAVQQPQLLNIQEVTQILVDGITKIVKRSGSDTSKWTVVDLLEFEQIVNSTMTGGELR